MSVTKQNTNYNFSKPKHLGVHSNLHKTNLISIICWCSEIVCWLVGKPRTLVIPLIEENQLSSSLMSILLLSHICGKFSHGRTEIKVAFETIGCLMDSRHILMRFTNEDDYHRVWIREQWYLKPSGFQVDTRV